MKNTVYRLLLIFFALWPLPTLAATDAKKLPRWFQIELLVFNYTRPDTSERFQRQPFEEADNSIASQATSLNALLGKQANGDNISLPADTETAASTAAEPPPATDPQVDATAAEPTFLATAAADLGLSDQAGKLSRNRNYRVLWHGAWQQPLAANSDSNTYLLSAGQLLLQPRQASELPETTTTAADEPLPDAPISDIETTDELQPVAEPTTNPRQQAEALVATAPPTFHELQGTLTIYKKRFTHLEFDLWFTTVNPTEPPLVVPVVKERIPPPPADETADSDVSARDFLDTALTDPDDEQQPSETGAQATDNETTPASINARDFLDTLGDNPALAELYAQQPPPAPPPPDFELSYQPAYTPAEFGQIKTDRRMTTNKLYYVDHPLFGALVYLTEVPHPSLRAEAEKEEVEDVDPLAF